MKYNIYAKRLDYLLELIKKERVCSPEQISSLFSCCDKTARNMINTLRKKGHAIKYDRQTLKYFIENR